MDDRTCTVVEDGERCKKPLRARGYCATHWSRWKRHGDPLVAGRRGVPGNPEAEAERRRKIAETSRGRTYGPRSEETRRKISEALSGRALPRERVETARAGMLARREVTAATSRAQWERWRAERGLTAPGYSQLHKIVRQTRGPASRQSCAECGRPARHWSQVHDTDGTDPMAHYRPLCQPCHFAYDRVAERSLVTKGPAGRKAVAVKAWETKRRNLKERVNASPDPSLADGPHG
jgi:hypothetical protein